MPTRKLNRGFTLLELLVVLGIAAMLLAVIPPMLSNVISSTQLKTATRHLSTGLKTARSKAISTQQEVTLAVDVQNNLFFLLDKKKQLTLPDDTKIILTTAKSEQLSDTEGGFRFFPDGSSTGGRITLRHLPFEYFIDINWLTGKVAISP